MNTHTENHPTSTHEKKPLRRMAWLEEYRHCSCSLIALKRQDLLGYCQKHGNDRKYLIRIPAPADADLGYAGMG